MLGVLLLLIMLIWTLNSIKAALLAFSSLNTVIFPSENLFFTVRVRKVGVALLLDPLVNDCVIYFRGNFPVK